MKYTRFDPLNLCLRRFPIFPNNRVEGHRIERISIRMGCRNRILPAHTYHSNARHIDDRSSSFPSTILLSTLKGSLHSGPLTDTWSGKTPVDREKVSCVERYNLYGLTGTSCTRNPSFPGYPSNAAVNSYRGMLAGNTLLAQCFRISCMF